jgi:hypothetical protein
MKFSDIWWLMKEIWPWTVGVTLLGATLNVILIRKHFGLVLGAAGVAALIVAAVFQVHVGWGGGELGVLGIAINYLIIWMPALAALLTGASASRLVTLMVKRQV